MIFLRFNCVEYCVFLAKQSIMKHLMCLTKSLTVEDHPKYDGRAN